MSAERGAQSEVRQLDEVVSPRRWFLCGALFIIALIAVNAFEVSNLLTQNIRRPNERIYEVITVSVDETVVQEPFKIPENKAITTYRPSAVIRTQAPSVSVKPPSGKNLVVI